MTLERPSRNCRARRDSTRVERQLSGLPKNTLSIGKLFELPLVSRNAIYDCAQDFNVLDLARVDRMQVFG